MISRLTTHFLVSLRPELPSPRTVVNSRSTPLGAMSTPAGQSRHCTPEKATSDGSLESQPCQGHSPQPPSVTRAAHPFQRAELHSFAHSITIVCQVLGTTGTADTQNPAFTEPAELLWKEKNGLTLRSVGSDRS